MIIIPVLKMMVIHKMVASVIQVWGLPDKDGYTKWLCFGEVPIIKNKMVASVTSRFEMVSRRIWFQHDRACLHEKLGRFHIPPRPFYTTFEYQSKLSIEFCNQKRREKERLKENFSWNCSLFTNQKELLIFYLKNFIFL